LISGRQDASNNEVDVFKKMVAALAVLTASAAIALAAPAGADARSINQLLHAMFDKPDVSLLVGPVMVSGDHAVADWVQGDMGGRALLHRREASWIIILCAGDAIKAEETLVKAGVPVVDARKLEVDIRVAESKLAPETVAMFSRFEGLVMLDGTPSHADRHSGHAR
jgi:hypothetical protein